MLYRDSGQLKQSYAADQQIFPILQDRVGMTVVLAFAFFVLPWIGSDYWLSAILTPFLVFSLAAIGLNLLTGYAGQLSLGTAAFMAVGAFSAYNLLLRLPGIPVLVSFVLAAVLAAFVGILFGLPSLRIRGFYLAVATLAAQFFVMWVLGRFPWFSNFNSSGVISAQSLTIFGIDITTPQRKYLLVLTVVVVLALAAKNLVRSSVGRAWMAVRDMDVAAGVIGIRLTHTKLLAFGIGSFYCGMAGVLYAYCYVGTIEPEAFSLDMSLRILFMVIIGGLGTILGSFLGAAFIMLVPILLNTIAEPMAHMLNVRLASDTVSNLELIIFGSLIILFLIFEPHGMARIWQVTKEKLRLWPFPH